MKWGLGWWINLNRQSWTIPGRSPGDLSKSNRSDPTRSPFLREERQRERESESERLKFESERERALWVSVFYNSFGAGVELWKVFGRRLRWILCRFFWLSSTRWSCFDWFGLDLRRCWKRHVVVRLSMSIISWLMQGMFAFAHLNV